MLKYLNYHPKKNIKVEWEESPQIKLKLDKIIKNLDAGWIDSSRIYCFKSYGSKAFARARIWGLPNIWQKALRTKPSYIIEVISEKFDNLSDKDKEEVLLHEIAHIPKTFSGALIPHYRKGKRRFRDKVNTLIRKYNR